MDRRTTIKWMLAAATTVPFLKGCGPGSGAAPAPAAAASSLAAQPYGTDPKLLKVYKPGEVWPLTFTPEQRRTATALSDLIIPADAVSASASEVGVIEFIDEWISAPYVLQQADRKTVLEGLQWIDQEAARRFSAPFHSLDSQRQRAICDNISYLPTTKAPYLEAARFFARYRDLTAGGFYTTPVGRKDLQYVGNTPMASFEGPPLEVLKKAGLA
jgi:hypothetical protein